jgi:hypothetical protein
MQRPFIVLLGILVLALVVPAASSAAPPVQERIAEDFVDDDFCGTGADVVGHFEGRATVWEGEDVFRITFNDKTRLTYNGVTLIDHFAGRTKEFDVPPATGAAETIEVIETGLRAHLKLANGRVLTSDHGLLHYRVSFDGSGEFIGIELLRDRGGHPAFNSDVWCRAATKAFGIPYSG